MAERDVDLINAKVTMCRQCHEGVGGECHTPGCALWLNRAPDISLVDNPAVAVIADAEGDWGEGHWESCPCGSEGWRCAECDDGIYGFPARPEPPTRQRVWDVISTVRDAAPRLPNDAATDAIIDALVDSGVLTLRSDDA